MGLEDLYNEPCMQVQQQECPIPREQLVVEVVYLYTGLGNDVGGQMYWSQEKIMLLLQKEKDTPGTPNLRMINGNLSSMHGILRARGVYTTGLDRARCRVISSKIDFPS